MWNLSLSLFLSSILYNQTVKLAPFFPAFTLHAGFVPSKTAFIFHLLPHIWVSCEIITLSLVPTLRFFFPENMESQLKMDHTASYGNEVGNVPNSSKSVPSQYLLRILVFATTLVAAVLTAINKETQNIPLKLGPDLPTVFVPILAKSPTYRLSSNEIYIYTSYIKSSF